jgi:hypothetical protein
MPVGVRIAAVTDRDKNLATLVFRPGKSRDSDHRTHFSKVSRQDQSLYPILSVQNSRWLKVELWPSPRAILQNFATLVYR